MKRPLLTMTWEHVLFMHWEADAEWLRRQLPPGVELDLYNGRAYIGLIPFFMTGIALTSLPRLTKLRFPELNVRTYVKTPSGRGIYFFSLDASHPLANIAANTLFQLPYRKASFNVSTDGPVHFQASRRLEKMDAVYAPCSPVFLPDKTSFAHWAVERYRFYTFGFRRWWAGDISHAPWHLQEASVSLRHNSMLDAYPAAGRMPDFYGRAASVTAKSIRPFRT
ncbi:YqjF family protein [Alkalicoccus urumqiensis]|uniref:DUF2071 domain-containing protein n=1 Tax=Alkalicoccus urumqiensis TaxID=1548213 RepID=A0A2P6ML57_ALKUR|nr:DUF2071 domain-containing protein [Alkalicoccus urumqiensis]PRO67017.1 hypothetical protein C6I21_00165 [Alkalicoccus urumqiensis]